MWSWRQLSIRWKLAALILLCTTLALILASAAVSIYVYVDSRSAQADRLGLLAEVVAENSSAALLFADGETAAELLGSLRAGEHVSRAVLFDAEARPFAVYPETAVAPALTDPATREDFGAEMLTVTRPVVLDGETVGYIRIEESLEPLRQRLRSHLAIALAALVAALIVTWFSSFGVQRIISRRIIRLADTAREVSLTQDYTLRVEDTDPDELGSLASRFNEMLARIESSRSALVRSQGELENKVTERTRELRGEVEMRRRVERELRDFARELERSNRDLQDFAYVASHDLQEPLRKIQAFGDRLAKSTDNLDERSQLYLDRMLDAATRMRALISDLLTFSRVATKGKPFEVVDLNEVLRRIVEDFEIHIEERDARVEIGELPVVRADPSQMRQLFQNLVGNALKFSAPGQKLTVRVFAEESSDDEDLARIVVEDTGIGIEEKYFDRIFGVFQRLHGRGTYPGSGMGLSICRRVVERHGGAIGVESKEGRGSRFFVDLPLATEPADHPQTAGGVK